HDDDDTSTDRGVRACRSPVPPGPRIATTLDTLRGGVSVLIVHAGSGPRTQPLRQPPTTPRFRGSGPYRSSVPGRPPAPSAPARRDFRNRRCVPMIDLAELGRRIRKLRLDRRQTLKQVEEGSGLSSTHLSEIERGRTSPTIGALVRIARALDRDASYFIELDERSDLGFTAREQRPAMRGTIQGEVLSPGIPGSCIYPYRLVLRPGQRPTLTLPT